MQLLKKNWALTFHHLIKDERFVVDNDSTFFHELNDVEVGIVAVNKCVDIG